MSELRALWDKHRKAISDLQENCEHVPYPHTELVRVAEGVSGTAILCSKCAKVLEWVEEPKRTHEVTYMPVEWIQ